MNNPIEYIEYPGFRGETEVKVHARFAEFPQARIALELAVRFGMIAAIPDGEDATGRQKLRLLTPEEVVDRATDTAELLHNEFEKRGWFLEIPAPKPPRERE